MIVYVLAYLQNVASHDVKTFTKRQEEKGINRIFCDQAYVKLECIKWNFKSGITIKFLKQITFMMASVKNLLVWRHRGNVASYDVTIT